MVLENFGVGERHPTALTNFHHHLYMVAQGDTSVTGSARSRTAALYKIGATTGAAIRVNGESAANDFGVGEERPTGLASLNNKLYMVGNTNKRLYEVNANTGIAKTVRPSTSTQFGISETEPTAIAYHQGVMYFIGDSTDYLCSLDLDTGEATRIGTASNFGTTGLRINDLTSDGTNLYGIGGIGTPITQEGLYIFNTTTGVATPVGVESFGVGELEPISLAVRPASGTGPNAVTKKVWMVGRRYQGRSSETRLYTIDLKSTKATVVNANVRAFATGEEEPTGIAYYDGTLYMAGNATKKLYRVKTESGEAGFQSSTPVGGAEAIGSIANFGLSSSDIPGDLTEDQTALYMVVNGNSFYQLNTSTGNVNSGRATAITKTDHGLSNVVGIASTDTDGSLYVLTSTSTGSEFGTIITGEALGRGSVSTTPLSAPDPGNLSGLLNSHSTQTPDSTNPLYSVSSNGNGSLYNLGINGSRATLVETTNFGLSTREDRPKGIAWRDTSDGGILYMVGDRTDSLYTLDKTTGEATLLGALSGPTIAQHRGLDWIDNKLYMLGLEGTHPNFTGAPYEIDVSDQSVTKIGSPAMSFGADAIENSPRSLSHITDNSITTVYMIGNTNDILYQLNLTTGLAYPNGITNFGGFTVTETGPLVSDGTNLYMYSNGSGKSIYKFNLDPDELNDQNGYGTLGNTARRGYGSGDGTLVVRGAAYDSTDGKFYITDDASATLRTITMTQNATADSVKVGEASLSEFGPDAEENDPQGIAFFEGQLYMLGQAHPVLYRVDEDTGVATKVGSEVAQTERRNAPEQFTTQSGGNSRLLFGEQTNYYSRVDEIDISSAATQVVRIK